MRSVVITALVHAVKVAWTIIVGLGVLAGIASATIAGLSAGGQIETSPAEVLELPANLPRMIDVLILAAEKYLEEP